MSTQSFTVLTTIITTLLITPVYGADLPILPDRSLTPGIADTSVGRDKICTKGYSSTVRNVSETTKNTVYKRYKLNKTSSYFEVDHLVSLQLGGSNDVRNLWPQSYNTRPWNASVKDKLENKLRTMICRGTIEVKAAQDIISSDWIKGYCSLYHDMEKQCSNYKKEQK